MITAPRGTRDIIAGDVDRWRYVESQVHEVCARFGYREIRTPLFEHSELFERLGEATDLVQKETYTFTDRGGRPLTLRPEGTAPVARAYLENGLANWPQPVKLYYIGPMFRYERPQSGRYRQHHQFGAELLGSASPAADAEVVHLALEFYRSLGLEQLRLDVNSIGCPACRPGYRQALAGYLDGVAGSLCGDCSARRERNVLRVLDCKEPGCRGLLGEAPRSLEYLCPDCSAHHDELLRLLDASGVGHTPNPRLVRGLDYYNRTVFEVISTSLGADRALGGGGRYDGLVSELGGQPTPGVGFGLGLERLLLTLEEEGRLLSVDRGLDVFFVTRGSRAVIAGFALVQRLRRSRIATDMDYLGRSIKAQMKQADRLRSRFVVILGDDELDRELAVIRDMESGQQREVMIDTLVGELADGLGND